MSKKTNNILKKCSEAFNNLEEKPINEELANIQIAQLLELVSEGTKCEKDIREVLKMYWEMKDNSTQEYRYRLN